MPAPSDGRLIAMPARAAPFISPIIQGFRLSGSAKKPSGVETRTPTSSPCACAYSRTNRMTSRTSAGSMTRSDSTRPSEKSYRQAPLHRMAGALNSAAASGMT